MNAFKCIQFHPFTKSFIIETDKAEASPRVSYQEDDSLAIEWSFPSADCQLLSTGVWIRVFESEQNETDESFLYIPNDCQTRKGDVASVVLTSGDQEEQGSQCSFSIPKLIACGTYTVELAVDYDSLQGRIQSSQVIITPKVKI